ncbi:MAG: deoxyribose-phosphate aldolase [Aerococcus sp.]|nr:deoxyribose-phosphate aldolase [Aerococcus sp.]
MKLTNQELAKKIDHTLLQPNATAEEIKSVCQEAIQFHTASVCVNSVRVKLAAECLSGTDVKPIAVVGFPFGAANTESKVAETERAIKDGAEEIDMVINIGALLDGSDAVVKDDIQAVAEATHAHDKLLKVIIEACYLTDEQKVKACQLAEAAGSDFVKTSTGFGSGGATLHDVELMRQSVSDHVGVKAAGGIHTRDEALAMLEAGANRLGMSATVKALSEES